MYSPGICSFWIGVYLEGTLPTEVSAAVIPCGGLIGLIYPGPEHFFDAVNWRKSWWEAHLHVSLDRSGTLLLPLLHLQFNISENAASFVQDRLKTHCRPDKIILSFWIVFIFTCKQTFSKHFSTAEQSSNVSKPTKRRHQGICVTSML